MCELKIDELKHKYYSGESWDGTKLFYDWLRAHIKKDFVVLNLGAGPTSNRKTSLRGEVSKVVGADIDEAVLKNDDLDEQIVIRNDLLPFHDNTFDAGWSDYVFEHVKRPDVFFREIYRVLKLGAPFFFRTPNKYHYVSLIAGATPHWFHNLIANRVRGISRESHDPYPTFFRLNSKRDISAYAQRVGFREIELRFVECEPSYLSFHPLLFLIGLSYERTVNRYAVLSQLRANIFGKLVK